METPHAPSSTLLALLLTLLLSLDLRLGPATCTAQMPPPLLGQGIDPWQAGETNVTVPVHVCVVLDKVLAIDEHNYEFRAMFTVKQSWRDPRADRVFRIANSARYRKSSALAQAQIACAGQERDDATGFIWNTTSDNCTEAYPKPEETCKRFCNNYGPGASDGLTCCDQLWIPNIEIKNLLQTPQDRVTFDRIVYLDNNTVYRETQVLGLYRSSLVFTRYPFDWQSLVVLMQPVTTILSRVRQIELGDGYPYEIVPSGVLRSNSLSFEVSAGTNNASVADAKLNELAGWSVGPTSFSCVVTNTSTSQVLIAGAPQWAASGFATPNVSATYQLCFFSITVSRLSNTLIASSVLPVAFISILSFVVFFTAPTELDLRLGTEVTLFLALTAVQFVFRGILPTTSYLTNFDAFIMLSYVLILVIVSENLLVCYISTRGEHKERMGDYYFRQQGTVFSNGSTVVQHSSETESNGMVNGDSDDAPAANGGRNSVPRLEADPKYAYSLACWIDIVAGISLFVVYAVVTILIFTVRG